MPGTRPSPNRRRFLRQAALCTGAFAGVRWLAGCTGGSEPLPESERFGALVEDPSGILDLPAGFRYRVVSRMGDTMSDGYRVPGAPDGMGAFSSDDGLAIIVRNHELDIDARTSSGPFVDEASRRAADVAALAHDPGADGRARLGGTTTFVWDTRKQRLVSDHLSLVGTARNCSGGVTPWGTWVTCEESAVNAGGELASAHGYAFEVSPSTEPGLQRAEPLVAMGRFKREAVAVDPGSGAVYQSEDTDDGLLYRFLPDIPGDLARGGRVQALALEGRPGLDIRNRARVGATIGESLPTRWIDLDDVDTPADDLRLRGHAAGAVRFARNEGVCMEGGTLWLCSTEGARSGDGQLWRYRPVAGPADRGVLDLVFESDARAPIEHLDTLVPAPWGDLLVTEDGGPSPRLAGITPEGKAYALARNATGSSELTGPVFSLDGTTLFLNLQKDGLTLAITGPWPGTPRASIT